mmetsp:Transcript_14487/g.43792  ORF Transcript_14487/g.43792 Transcript_14487/m.43792 type:complete len:285 (+) Transcript_14487:239-1093(+)
MTPLPQYPMYRHKHTPAPWEQSNVHPRSSPLARLCHCRFSRSLSHLASNTSIASVNRTGGGSCPVDWMVKMKRSLCLRTRRISSHSGSPDSRLTFSRWCSLPRVLTTASFLSRPSPSRRKSGGCTSPSCGRHSSRSSSAFSPSTSFSSTISGSSRYQAVATGDHLACSAPIPLVQWASSSMDCPGRILASSMSGKTAAMSSVSPRASLWSSLNVHCVSSGISLPPDKYCRSCDSTFSWLMLPSALRVQSTCSLSTTVLRSVAGLFASLQSSFLGSRFIGISPSL